MNTENSIQIDIECEVYSSELRAKVGRNIKALAEAKGLTIKNLADIIDYSRKAIYNWINGKDIPSNSVIEPLASAFGMKPYELLFYNVPLDVAYLRQELNKNYEPLEHPRDLTDASLEDCSSDDCLDNYSLEEYLALELNVDIYSVFYKKEMPDLDTQTRIANAFNLSREDIFLPAIVSSKIGKDDAFITSKYDNIFSKVDVDEKLMLKMFRGLSGECQKLVFNIICDQYKICNKR